MQRATGGASRKLWAATVQRGALGSTLSQQGDGC